MARGDQAKAGVLRLIAGSAQSLTVNYPPKRIPATGSVTLPLAPLTGPVQTPTLVPGAPPAPEKAPVTIQCLWYDTPTGTELTVSHDKRSYGVAGWRQGAAALARVAIADAALDPTKPYGKSIFDGCDFVTHAELKFQVLGITRSDAGGFNVPYSLYVWLSSDDII